jgi:hypothetical protein
MRNSIQDIVCLDKQSPNYNPAMLLDTEKTSVILGVTSGTLNVWRSTHRYSLKYVKCGRLVKYRVEDILDFINSQTVSPNA